MNIESLLFFRDEEHAPQKDEGFFHINPLPSPLLLKAEGTSILSAPQRINQLKQTPFMIFDTRQDHLQLFEAKLKLISNVSVINLKNVGIGRILQ